MSLSPSHIVPKGRRKNINSHWSPPEPDPVSARTAISKLSYPLAVPEGLLILDRGRDPACFTNTEDVRAGRTTLPGSSCPSSARAGGHSVSTWMVCRNSFFTPDLCSLVGVGQSEDLGA